MTKEQILKQRELLKRQELTKRKRYYQNLEKKAVENAQKRAKTDYQKKFERTRKRYEQRFDKKTDQLVKNEERKDKWTKKVVYKVKKKSITWTQVKAIIQKYVRLRDSDEKWYWNCIVTGQRLHYKKANGWHYISASYKKTALNPDNIHLQSPGSNKAMSMWDKTADYHLRLYRENLIKKIGLDRVLKLEKEHEERKYKVFKWNKWDLEDIFRHYTLLVKDLESKKQQDVDTIH